VTETCDSTGPNNRTKYSYDGSSVVGTTGTPQHVNPTGSRGNATTISQMTSGSSTISQTFTYFDTGNVQTVTDTNNAQTTYTYSSATASCGNSFPTGVNEPLSLTRSFVWNCSGAVQTSMTDENSKNWTTTYNDANFWRPTAKSDPTSASTSITYGIPASAWWTESTLNFNGTTSTADTRITLDNQGRPHVTQQKQSQSSSNYDSVETDYDSLGRTAKTTIPYTGTAGQTSSGNGTTTVYDALSRPTQVTDAGNGWTKYTYAQNDVLIETGPLGTGDSNTKKRQLQYDGLGRLTSVCEVSSASGSGTCGQTTSQTGFWTKYTYDLLNNLAGVTQNAQSGSTQTRTYQYDGLSRMTSEANPETVGSAYTYVYDTGSPCSTSNGDMVKRTDPVGNVTCYAYDALRRVTSVQLQTGSPYLSVTPDKHFVYDSATVNSVVMSNAKGRLAEAYTGPSKTTDLGFSYSARGEVADVYQKSPNSGGYYHVSATYWANGLQNTLFSSVQGPSRLPKESYRESYCLFL
jgi:YD repeat-containing protein